MSPPQVTTAKLKEKIKLQEPERVKKHMFFRICFRIAYNPLFVIFSLIIILANSILLGFIRYPMKNQDMNRVEYGLMIFIFYFFFELVIRISAMGIRNFSKDLENLVETLTVIFGLSNFIYEKSQGIELNENNNLLKAIRSLMLLRIIKVMNFFKSIKLIMKTIRQTIWKMLDFVIVVFIFMFVAALVGMQLFAYRVRFDPDDDHAIFNATE